MGFVYLITSDYKNYKIGSTKRKVEDRIKELQTACHEELQIVKSYETNNYIKVEKWLHRKFFSKKKEGEWFELEDEEINLFEENCKNIDKTISLLIETNPFFN